MDASNEVLLVGRLAAAAQERELPSGDLLTTWRLVVDRPPRTLPEGVRQPSIDTFDCATWSAGVRKQVAAYSPGDVLRVEGALRRRFWRAGTSAASRYEVEVTRVKRVAKAA